MAKFRVEKKKYFDYGQKATDLELNSLELRLKKEYEKASKEVAQKMNKHLNDFYRKDEERRKLVDMGEWTQQDYIEWRQGQLYIAGRWSELSNSIAQDYVNTNKIASQMITDNNYDVFALNHNYGLFEVDSVKSLGDSFMLYDRNAVKQLAKGNKKLPLQTKLNVPKDFKWNKRQIESSMMQGLLQGESIDKIAKRLPLAVGERNLNGATRRARTLTTFASNSGRLEAYYEAEELGVELEKCWVATLDNRTRDSHAMIDGETVPLDDEFSNGLMYPGDENGDPEEVYNCRCTMVAQVKGHEVDVTDLENRNVDHLESDYETWYSNHTPYEWEDTEEKSTEERSTNNLVTIDKQYRNVPPMNEYDYWGNEENVKQRFNDIQSLSGFDDKKTQEVLEAFSGNAKEWNYDYDNTPQGWFYRADDKIRDRNNKEWEKTAKTIDDYIMAAPKYEGNIYRGLSLDQSVIDEFKIGSEFKETGRLSSWTSDKNVAEMFAEGRSEELNKKPVIIKSENPTYGTPAAHLSLFGSDEQEVLVSNMHDVQFFVADIKERNGIVEIILKERRK